MVGEVGADWMLGWFGWFDRLERFEWFSLLAGSGGLNGLGGRGGLSSFTRFSGLRTKTSLCMTACGYAADKKMEVTCHCLLQDQTSQQRRRPASQRTRARPTNATPSLASLRGTKRICDTMM